MVGIFSTDEEIKRFIEAETRGWTRGQWIVHYALVCILLVFMGTCIYWLIYMLVMHT